MRTPLSEKIEWLADCAEFCFLFLTLPIWIWFYMVYKICKKIWGFLND